MVAFFKKPYPYIAFSKKDIYSSVLIACFVSLFLIVFQPFGVSIWKTDYKVLKLVGFGCVCFICTIIFKLVFLVLLKKNKPEETWTVWKEMFALILVIVFIAFGNLCYSNLIGISHFGFEELLFALIATFLLAFFPIMANITLKYNRFVLLNQKDAALMEAEVLEFQQRLINEIPQQKSIIEEVNNPELIVLISENEKDKLELAAEELLYIESADNYSNVVFIKNKVVTKQLIRGSLKRLELQIPFQFIIRCHRSYIVNLKQVNYIKGNAQGYKIEFKTDNTNSISASRNYSKLLFERLESLK